MFKLVALFMLVVAPGAPVGEPEALFNYGKTFSSQEDCMNFFDTVDGKRAKASIEALSSKDEGQYTIDYKCVKIEGTAL